MISPKLNRANLTSRLLVVVALAFGFINVSGAAFSQLATSKHAIEQVLKKAPERTSKCVSFAPSQTLKSRIYGSDYLLRLVAANRSNATKLLVNTQYWAFAPPAQLHKIQLKFITQDSDDFPLVI